MIRALIAILTASGAMFLVLFGHTDLALVEAAIGELLVSPWGDA